MSFNIGKLKDVNPDLTEQLRSYTYDIIGCCQQVHKELGPFLNEYIYQEALRIVFEERNIVNEKEYYFTVPFHGQWLQHRHYVDFKCHDDVLVECKAIEHIGPEQRQQLWNYMRLSGLQVGILYNFAPIKDECERYYYDSTSQSIYAF